MPQASVKTKTNQLAATRMKALELQAFQVIIKALGRNFIKSLED